MKLKKKGWRDRNKQKELNEKKSRRFGVATKKNANTLGMKKTLNTTLNFGIVRP